MAEAASASSAPADTTGVWSALLHKSTRKSKEINSTLVVCGQTQGSTRASSDSRTSRQSQQQQQARSSDTRDCRDCSKCCALLGDKRSGKSALLAKFSDRISSDSIPSSSSSGERGAANSLLASASSAPEYSLDFSYTPVKNRHAIAAVSGGGSSGGDKEEVLARMNIWQLDDAQHCSLIPCFLQTGQHGAQQQAGANSLASPTSASAVAPASSSSSSAAVSPSHPLDFSSLDSAVFMLTFDLSEPWRALDTITTWLNAISKIILPALAALPEAQAKALKAKISKYTQSYYAPTADEAATDSLSSPTASSSSFDPLSPSASSSPSNGAPPINPALPLHNLGVPIIIVGTKGDLFARHLGARSGGGASSGSGAASGVDEKFDFLTRKLRKLCMDWGATLVYTSVAHHATGASRKEKDAGVNVEVLQHYILHRLYKFPLNPAAAAAADAAAAAAGVTDAKSPTAAAAASAAAAAAKFQPRVVGSAEDDFSIYIPAGYDSESLLETTSKNAVSASYNDATPVEEVLKNPQASRRKAAAGGGQQQFDTVAAEDNAVFFKQLKHNLEQGGGGSALSLAAGLSSLGAPAHQRTATSVSAPKSSTPSHGHTASVSVVSPTSGLTAEQKATAAAGGAPAAGKAGSAAPAAAGGAAGAAAGAAAAGGAGAGAAPVKGQIAVKQFFRSLLNNTSKPDANSKAAAQQKVVRANAEKELQRMTEGAPPQP